MKTIRWNMTERKIDIDEAIKEATNVLRDGHTVAFPTETVYGLGADATNAHAVKKIFIAKGRPQDNPLIAHVASKAQLLTLISDLPTYAEKLIDAFSPGPITFVLPSNGVCAHNVTAGLETVAVRIPDHPVALQLLTKFNGPVAAPSANISGKPSPTTADHVWSDLAGKIAGILDGGPTGVGMESTVLDCTEAIPQILRPGAISEEQIREVVGEVATVTEENKAHVKSPGTKYKHYAPDVPLWIVSGSVQFMQEVIDEQQARSQRVGVLASSQIAKALVANQKFALGESPREIATHLYEGLRTFTKENTDLIVCESFPEKGIGQALMNRIKKASSKYIQE